MTDSVCSFIMTESIKDYFLKEDHYDEELKMNNSALYKPEDQHQNKVVLERAVVILIPPHLKS